ncbi:MAG: 4-hydroxy-3-methylbut-2-enyl diphosphate reductase [Candidatus Omnitrophica bacterium]|nr:4-hydroxy-3-methylbut-2-enyl diphosphate reductase [Candidatus Omnitrophota bacterium]
MLKIKLARHIGFCSGVRRAIKIAQDTLSKSKREVYSLGAIIHNPEVIKGLQKKGLRIAGSLNDIKADSCVILPSHGSPRRILAAAKKKKLKLIDVTCPYVSSVHKICSNLHKRGLKPVIIGDRQHPEIKALMDLVPDARLISRIDEVPQDKFSYQKIGIISQTTQSREAFLDIVSSILRKNPLVKEVCVFNTICLDTVARQEEVKKLAGAVDTLLVIGSSSSANTKRLLSIGKKVSRKTYLVENKNAPLSRMVKNAGTIGIISGASAPDWLAEEIVNSVKKIKNHKK